MRVRGILGVLLSLFSSAALFAAPRGPDLISQSRLLENTSTLASDTFEGRGPGTHGEDLTVEFLVSKFKALGLSPGLPDGSWTQKVPIIGIKSEVQATFGLDKLTFPQDFVAWSPKQKESVSVEESDMVFVGYGIEAPEYQWDDYKGTDLHGKTLVMLINDPPIPDPVDSTKLDANVFKGDAMTYYGRWTYKFEEAARRGAAAAVIIHETKPAAYPWFVVINSWGREKFDLDGSTAPTVKVASWISLEYARKLFAATGLSFETLKRSAQTREFQPVDLGVRASFTAHNTIRSVESRNVLAKRVGSDPKLRDEYVIYTAHWDHLGTNNLPDTSDHIFNGAADNAIGAAGLLELAAAFADTNTAPKRSIVFAAVTAEEQGLLGAAYYASHPAYPLKNTLANINIDGLNQWGKTKDIRVVGYGNSTLEDVLQKAVTQQKRVMLPEAHPERGTFYRSDHFEFAKVGVPALYLHSGNDYKDKPPGYGEKRVNEYLDQDYHKVSDEVKPEWDLSGAVEDLRLLYATGFSVAGDRKWPVWKVGSEFKGVRELYWDPKKH
ncbi:MAG TPA: M20/M25/M40 family metallo-hydrolase [Candidatus Limnocylindria bacterium]|nr:M20/M25/M40 family metallo-hydrolase [Candidatus Limnocylindria bacterium]